MSTSFCLKDLSAEGRREARPVLGKLPNRPDHDIPLVDHLMSGSALFRLEYPSLPQFDHDPQEEKVRATPRSLHGIERPPCGTCLRQRLDAFDPVQLRPRRRALFAQL